MTLPEARAFGALALFGETYGEQVRVVEIGGPWSRELCGGTHVRGSAQIGTLALTGESSVGSGSRRVEAVVGLEGFRYLARERDLVRQLAELLKAPQDGLVERVGGMLSRLRDVDRELAELRGRQTLAAAGELAGAARDVGGVAVVTGAPAGLGGGDLRTLALDVRGRLGERPAVVLLASESGGKVALVAALNPAALAQGLSANDVLKAAAGPVGGRGGGKADVAQGGGTDAAGIPAALQAGEQAVAAATGGELRARRTTVPSTTPTTPARSGAGGASCPPSRRRGPGRPPGAQPVHHPTTEIDLSQGFPPVSNETTEIDLSGGWPAHLKVPPKPAARPGPTGRVLGVDVGTVRVGLALSDPTGTLASPLETLQRAKDGADLDRLAALVVEHEVTEVVVGEPRHLSGASGASAADATAYSQALADRMADVPVYLIDERLSTVTAASHLRQGGIDSRNQRSVIDQAAAVVILQQYLDSRRARS